METGDEPYYPVNDDKNMALYAGYRELAQQEKNVLLGEGWGSTAIMTWIRF